MSARGALEPLLRLFGVDAVARGGAIAWRAAAGARSCALAKDDLVLGDKEPSLRLTRAQETELPQQVEIGFTEGEMDYRRAAVASRRLAGASRREARADSAVVTRRAEAQRLADTWLQDLWAGRERRRVRAVAAADRARAGRRDRRCRPMRARGCIASRASPTGRRARSRTRAVEPAVFERPGSSIAAPGRSARRRCPASRRRSCSICRLAIGDPAALQYIAVAADPWPGAMTIWRSGNGASFAPYRILDLPA